MLYHCVILYHIMLYYIMSYYIVLYHILYIISCTPSIYVHRHDIDIISPCVPSPNIGNTPNYGFVSMGIPQARWMLSEMENPKMK